MTPVQFPSPQNDEIGLLTSQTLEMILHTEQAVEHLARQREQCKLSPHPASAVAKELRQLRIVLGGYKYQHSADKL